MTEMESEGISWQDNDGNPRQLMPLLRIMIWMQFD